MSEQSRTFAIVNELDRAKMIAWCQKAALKDSDGQPMVWVARRRKRRRSLNQSALFHVWVHIMAVYSGETDAKMKDDVKRALLPLEERVNKFTGEIRLEPRQTSKMTKAEMSEFMTRVQALAHEHFDITLPTPDDPASFEAYEEMKGMR